MRLVNNDPYVKPLKCENLALINRLFTKLNVDTDQAFQGDVYLFETIHGHIVLFRRKESRKFGGDKDAARLDANSLKLITEITPYCRWIEAGHNELTIGLKRCK